MKVKAPSGATLRVPSVAGSGRSAGATETVPEPPGSVSLEVTFPETGIPVAVTARSATAITATRTLTVTVSTLHLAVPPAGSSSQASP